MHGSSGERVGLSDVDPHLGATGLAAQLAARGLPGAVAVERLVFNPNNPVTGSVDRVALTDGTTVVRKVLCRDRPVTVAHWPAGEGPSHWNHWRREADAYDAGATRVFDDAGVRAPDLLGRVSPVDGVEVLFLEWVQGRSGAALDVADLAALAGRLGVAQGSLGPPPAGATWASRGWMWAYAGTRPPGPAIHAAVAAWEHPVVVAGFGEARHRIRARWGEVLGDLDAWRSLATALPRTTGHMDCWSSNVVVADGGPVLLDWSFVGEAMVGEDPGTLVPDGLLDHMMPPEAYGPLDAAVGEAYAAGLDSAGWPHPLEAARLGMCLGVLRYAWLAGLMVHNADFTGPTAYGAQEGPDLVEVFARRAVVLDAMLARLDEARRLARTLGLSPP